MGFFSWITQDTGESIANFYSDRSTFPVTMTDNKGNKWHEDNYEGYGVFGGKDFYELVAEMNDVPDEQMIKKILNGHERDMPQWKVSEDTEKQLRAGVLPESQETLKKEALRSIGIGLVFGEKAYISPNLTRNPNREWENRSPKNCEFQGYFYE